MLHRLSYAPRALVSQSSLTAWLRAVGFTVVRHASDGVKIRMRPDATSTPNTTLELYYGLGLHIGFS